MTSVNNTSLSNYYPLSGQQSGTPSDASTGSSGASLTQMLESALQSAQDPSQGSNPDAFLLDLSPTAQQLLSSSGSTTGATSTTSTHFVLTTAQQTAIHNILEKYKNAPFDQATFDQIQSDLQAAGLGANQLSAQDQVSSFSGTSVLLGDLNGNYTDPASQSTSTSAEQTKASNYMQGIISAWQSISATAPASAAASAS